MSLMELLIRVCWLLAAAACGVVGALESVDVHQPILRLSPARGSQDRFGFAATAHQRTSSASHFTHQQALEDVVVLVGAPHGRYPGGLDLPLNRSICQQTGNYTEQELLALNDTQIRSCYRRTGLVYQCPLVGGTECSAVLGNGDKDGADGTLFDRRGMLRDHNRTDQMMGYSLLSSGDYFVACAPLWKKVEFDFFDAVSEILPQGRCVLSGRNLTNFSYIRPCRIGTSSTQLDEGYCTAGVSIAISKDMTGNQSRLAVGTIGSDSSRGGVFYYDNLMSGQLSSPEEMTPPRTPDYISSFYGYNTVAGKFDGNSDESFFVSAPRFSSHTSVGQVYAVENITKFPSVTQQGDQFGEYFGYSMTVADLNGDGYDDLVVGAPFYSDQSVRERGRVVILYNDKGEGLVRNTTIVGKTANGRFGHSLASLGDLNNDGFEDFAVSAPYQDGGTVYIYYGKASGDDGVIVNITEQQVITAEQIVSQLTSLGSLTSFGYTLNGQFDVDNNKYRDLVVGAYESQAVFVLRSVPVANIELEIITQVQDVDFRNKLCVLSTGPVACFDFSVCGRYLGKGLDEFVANFTLREVVSGTDASRLFFNPINQETSVYRAELLFPGPAIRVCNNYTAYIRNNISNTIGSLSFTVTMEQFDRSLPPVSIDHVPTTFSSVPVIKADTVTAEVSFLVQCGSDRVCDSDLELSQANIMYINSNARASEFQDALTVDVISQVNITLQYANLGEDAFDPFLTFTLPPELSSPRIYSATRTVTCTPSSTTDTNSFRCIGFQDPLSKADKNSEFTLNVQVSSDIDVGSQLVVPFTFMIRNVARNRENNTFLANNHINVTIPVQARASAQVRIVVQPNPTINYLGNQTVAQITSKFPSRDITYSFIKTQSSSTIHNTSLFVYLPVFARQEGENNRYFLYPSAISMRSSEISCDEAGVINPENINNLTPTRRRRHLMTRKHSSDIYGDLRRLVRQTSATDTAAAPSVNCSRSPLPNECVKLTCRITELSSNTVSLTVTVFLDERFFLGSTETYNLVTFAEAVIHDRELNQTGSILTESASITLKKEPGSGGMIPVYAIILPIVAAVVLIIVLVIILYFCGFFRRKSLKQRQQEEEEDEEEEVGSEVKGTEPKADMGSVTTDGDSKRPLSNSPLGEGDEQAIIDPSCVEERREQDGSSKQDEESGAENSKAEETTCIDKERTSLDDGSSSDSPNLISSTEI